VVARHCQKVFQIVPIEHAFGPVAVMQKCNPIMQG
jgi:hypothetical protein